MSSTYDIKIQKVPPSIGTSATFAKYADTASLLRGNAETNNIKSLSGGNIAVSNNISMLNGAVVTGNLTGTASYATNLTNTTYLITSSYAYNVINAAPNALNLQYPNNSTASYAMNALTAAFALNGGTGGGNPDAIPIGSIVAFAANTAPQGWLLCDGGYYDIGVEISAAGTYANLYNAISSSASDFGKRYNWSLSSWVQHTTGRYFKVPDLRGVFVRGYNNGLVANGFNGVTSSYDSGSNRKLGSLQQDAFRAHNHDIGFDNFLGSQYGTTSVSSAHRQAGWGDSNTNYNSALTSITGGAETRPVNVSLNYYIKYASTISLSDLTTVYNTPVGGDTSGSVSNITVTGLRNRPIDSAVDNPVSGAMLQYNGSSWIAVNASNLTNNLTNKIPTVMAFSNPLGAISSGSFTYVMQYNRHSSISKLLKINRDTSNASVLYNSNASQDFANMSMLKSSTGVPYIAWNSNSYSYTYNLTTGVISYIDCLNMTYTLVAIDDINLQSGKSVFYYFNSDYNGTWTLNNLPLYKVHSTDGTNWTQTDIQAGDRLNLVGKSFTNSSIFNNFEPVNTNILFFFYNAIKRRLYLMTTGTGLLHIFNINNYFSSFPNGNLVSWYTNTNTNRLQYLSYEKSICVLGNDAYWTDNDADHYSLEYDLTTGQEYSLTAVRRGHSDLNGSVIRVPWVE